MLWIPLITLKKPREQGDHLYMQRLAETERYEEQQSILAGLTVHLIGGISSYRTGLV